MAQAQAPNPDQQALALIRSSGILNPNATLDQIMDISGKISELQGEEQIKKDAQVFIHPNFVFKNTGI
jgi:hypothetical protein